MAVKQLPTRNGHSNLEALATRMENTFIDGLQVMYEELHKHIWSCTNMILKASRPKNMSMEQFTTLVQSTMKEALPGNDVYQRIEGIEASIAEIQRQQAELYQLLLKSKPGDAAREVESKSKSRGTVKSKSKNGEIEKQVIQVMQLLQEQPDATEREIAKMLSVSPSCAHKRKISALAKIAGEG